MAPGAVRALFGAGLLAGAGCSMVMGIDADRYVAVEKDAADDTSTGPAGRRSRDHYRDQSTRRRG